MEIFVEKANVGQTKNGKPKTGLLAKGVWHNIFDAHPEYEKKKVEITPSRYQGWYEARLLDTRSESNGNGLDEDPQLIVNWAIYENYLRMAHKVAMELEPDTLASDQNNVVVVDRSRARAALVNTAMIAVFGKDSKIVIEDLKVPF